MAGAGAGSEPVEVVVRHAIRGNEIKVSLPRRARFRHVKTAVSRLLDHGDDLDFMESGVLLHKDTGVYAAYRDGDKIGEVRRVLVCSAALGQLGDARMELEDDELSDDSDGAEPAEASAPLPIDPELVTYRPPPKPARKPAPVVVRSAREVLAEKAKKHLHIKAIQKDVLVVVREEFLSDNAEGEEVRLEKGQRGRIQQIDDPQVGFALIAFTAHRQHQWVFQSNFHRLGLAEELREGTHIVIREDFLSDSHTGVLLKAGLRGKVTGVDDDGDATVAFDAHDQEQWVNRKHFDMLRVVSGVESEPLSRDEALALQWELHEGFSEAQFQQDLSSLQDRREAGALTQAAFGKARQALFMRVQGVVLPKYGFEASGLGVIRMMGEMGTFVADPEMADLSKRVNVLLGLEMPAEKFKQLTDDCGAVSHCKEPDPLLLMPPGPPLAAPAMGAAEAAQPPPAQPPAAQPPAAAGGRAAPSGAERPVLPEGQGWPAGEPPPVKVFIVGSWAGFKPVAMTWEAGAFEHRFETSSPGGETFQLRRGRSVAQTIYPSAADASVFDEGGAWALRGPDDRGLKKYWKIGKHPQDKAAVGDRFAIHVLLDVHGNVAGVHWTRS